MWQVNVVLAKRVVAMAVMIGLGPLAGCLGDDHLEPFIEIPPPSIGDRVHYTGVDGSTISLEVVGTGARYDGHFRNHQSLLIDIIYTTPDGHVTEHQEAVDLAKGLHVQRVTFTCDACGDQRLQLNLGSSGTTGGFGVGPLWMDVATSIEARHSNFPTTTGAFQTHYELLGPSAQRPECFDMRLKTDLDPSARFGYISPLQVLDGTLVVCEGESWPLLFEPEWVFDPWADSADTTTYTRTRYDRGALPIDTGAASAWEVAPTTPLREWSPPYFLIDDHDFGLFPVVEAHEFAMEHDRVYRDLITNSSQPMLEATSVRYSGGRGHSEIPLLREKSVERYYERKMVVTDGTGRARHLNLEKTIKDTEGKTSTDFKKLERATQNDGIIVSDRFLSSPHLDPMVTAEIARSWIGDLVPGGLHWDFKWRNTSVFSESEDRQDGLNIQAWFYASDPRERTRGGVEVPFGIRMDGPSGAVLTISYPNAARPFGPDEEVVPKQQ